MPDLLLQDKVLIKLLKQAYSAEKAAGFRLPGPRGLCKRCGGKKGYPSN